MSSILESAKKFYEVYNDKKLDLIDSIFTDDYVGHVNAHDIVGAANAKGFIIACARPSYPYIPSSRQLYAHVLLFFLPVRINYI